MANAASEHVAAPMTARIVAIIAVPMEPTAAQ
jgi:hypothetical protein